MSLLAGEKTYWKFLGGCTQCGHCKQSCASLLSANMTLGNVAEALLNAQNEAEEASDLAINIIVNESLVQAVRGCFFCTSCKNTCFAHNDVCSLIYAARTDFQNLGLIDRAAWSSVLVDQEWDIFKAYRAIHGIYFNDLVRHISTEATLAQTDCKVAFFPGCSMAAYAPALTREIFAELEALGGKTTLIDHCCGSPLKSAGFYSRAEALCEKIAQEIYASGASVVVCVCPGCANAMRAVLNENVKVECLTKFLSSRGFKPKKPLPENLCISKSCQDRTGTYLDELVDVLGIENWHYESQDSCAQIENSCATRGATCESCEADTADAPQENSRALQNPSKSVPVICGGCCGAGGAVGPFQPSRVSAQTNAKLNMAPKGSCVVTLCPTCTYTYASTLLSEPRNIENKHYAELLFENSFDWELVFAQLNSMWSGEYGAWLAEVFA